MSIRNNIEKLKESLPATCSLIAVSKTQPIDKLKEAYNAGQRAFGENKAQELSQKYPEMPTNVHWHMIGHLQSNKVKYIAPFVHLIHSVDSLKLLIEINKQAQKNNRKINCLLQVHIADEQTKFGFSGEEVMELVRGNELSNLTNIKIVGLMGMATLTEDVDKIRSEFRALKAIFEKSKLENVPTIEMKELSMGMSSDYKIAIEEGSTLIRVGTAIFGERN